MMLGRPAETQMPEAELIRCGARACISVVFPNEHGDTRCEGCDEYYCQDHLTDQCACSEADDGSGQHVRDLPGLYCEDCHDGYHLPWELS